LPDQLTIASTEPDDHVTAMGALAELRTVRG
jgi:hypothetical protein